MSNQETAALILTAGKGTRMRSGMIKMIHDLCGQPLVKYVLDASEGAGIKRNIIILGYDAERVKETLGGKYEYVLQKEQMGTGHAVLQAADLLKDYDGNVLVIPGDAPFLTAEVLSELISRHRKTNARTTILTAVLPDAGNYGRIVRGSGGNVVKIVEKKDAGLSELEIREVNSGTYCFDAKTLFKLLPEIDRRNTQGEYYLTDVIGLMFGKNLSVETVIASDHRVVLGVNNRYELAEALRLFREKILEELMMSGVTIIDPESTFIDLTVKIGQDTIVYPFTVIERDTTIGKNCVIGPHAHLSSAKIGSGVKIQSSVVTGAAVADNTELEPYTNVHS